MNTLLQDFQGLADLVPYRIDGQIQFFGYLFIFESVTLTHNEDLAAFFGKRVNRRPKLRFGLRAFLCIVIVDDSVGVVWLEGFGWDAFLTKMVQTTVSHHHI